MNKWTITYQDGTEKTVEAGDWDEMVLVVNDIPTGRRVGELNPDELKKVQTFNRAVNAFEITVEVSLDIPPVFADWVKTVEIDEDDRSDIEEGLWDGPDVPEEILSTITASEFRFLEQYEVITAPEFGKYGNAWLTLYGYDQVHNRK